MPKLLLQIVVILLPFLSWSQKACMPRLFKSAEQIGEKSENAERIKYVGYSSSGQEIIAYTYDNKKIELLSRLVWGYQDKDCTIYRNSGSHFFKVEQAGEMIIYSLQSRGFRSRLTTFYYFSKSFDAPVFLLDGENLAGQYKDNACFVDKIKKKFNSPFSHNYASMHKKSFDVIELLRSCK